MYVNILESLLEDNENNFNNYNNNSAGQGNKKKNLISQIQINSNSNNKLCKAIKVGSYLLIDNLLEGSHILRKNQVLTHIVAIPYLH